CRLSGDLSPDDLDRLRRRDQLAARPFLTLGRRHRPTELRPDLGQLGLGLAPRLAQDLLPLPFDVLEALLQLGADPLGRAALVLAPRELLVARTPLGLYAGEEVLDFDLPRVDELARVLQHRRIQPQALGDRQRVALAGQTNQESVGRR